MWLDRKELPDFLAALTADVRLCALVLLHGVGASEAAGLTWEQYDGQYLTINAQDQIIRGKVQRRAGLKRPRRHRKVPVSDTLKAELDALNARGDRVLLTQTGKHWNRSTIAQQLTRKLKGTKWEGIGPHDLRRSGGKWMLDAGAKLNDVADILGNDIKVLLLHYDRSDDKGKRDAISRAF
jgi:integrase